MQCLINRKLHILKPTSLFLSLGQVQSSQKINNDLSSRCEEWVLCFKVTLQDLPLSLSPFLDASPGCCHLLLASSHLSEHCLLSFCLAYVRWGADPTPSHQATGAGPSNIVPLLLAAESRRRGGGDLPCSTDSRGGMPAAGLGWCQEPCWDGSGSALRDLCRNGATSLDIPDKHLHFILSSVVLDGV